MTLLDTLNALKKDVIDFHYNHVKIICGTTNKTIYEGKLKDTTNLMCQDMWKVVEITRMNEWNDTSMISVPIEACPYRIVVV